MPNILIVEDNAELLKAIETKLKLAGYKTVSAEDGEEALVKIEKERPEAVLLDILLPKKNGMEVLEEVNKDRSRFGQPIIIIISNSGQTVEMEQAKHLGAKDFLIKTDFTPQEVLDKLQKYVSAPLVAKPASPKVRTDTALKPKAPALNKLVLVVEDDDLLRRLLAKSLTNSGFTVDAVSSGKEALASLVKQPPLIVLLDLVMPGIDGFQVLQEIRNNPKIKDLPVIILSNLGDDASVERTKKLGVSDYLIKADIFLGEVENKVKEVIAKHYPQQ